MTTISLRPIHMIARDIRKEWKKVYFGAVPYLGAMGSLTNTTEMFGQDDAASIVRYFLSNASTFRGGNAKVLKDELKAHLKASK